MTTSSIALIGDLHLTPALPNDRCSWIGREIRQRRPDAIVQIGDFASFDSLSRHDANDTLRGKRKPSFKADLDCIANGLERLEEGLGSATSLPKHLTDGNHEDRLLSFTDRNPEVEGFLPAAFDRLLAGAGWLRTGYGRVLTLSGVDFTHIPFNGESKPFGGETAWMRIAARQNRDLVWGHDHRGGLFPYAKNNGEAITLYNAACALPWGHVEPYALHGLTAWRYGITFLEIIKGKIAGVQWVDMRTLQQRWGKK